MPIPSRNEAHSLHYGGGINHAMGSDALASVAKGKYRVWQACLHGR